MSAFASSTKKDAGSSESSKPSASKPQYFSVEAKIQKALGYKEKGNVSFKAKKYRKAIRMYHFMFAGRQHNKHSTVKQLIMFPSWDRGSPVRERLKQ